MTSPAVATTTWLTPACEAWEDAFGKGTFPFGMAGRFLKPLSAAGHSSETIGAHLAAYIAANDPKYLNLARFAQTFQAWAPKVVAPAQAQDGWDMLVDADGVVRCG